MRDLLTKSWPQWKWEVAERGGEAGKLQSLEKEGECVQRLVPKERPCEGGIPERELIEDEARIRS